MVSRGRTASCVPSAVTTAATAATVTAAPGHRLLGCWRRSVVYRRFSLCFQISTEEPPPPPVPPRPDDNE